MSFKLSTGNTAYPSISVSIDSNTDTTARLAFTPSCYLDNGWVQSTGVVSKIYWRNNSSESWQFISQFTLLGNGTKYTAPEVKSATHLQDYIKTTSSKTIYWAVDFHQYTEGTDQGCKETIYGSTTISAITSYTVSYNANGGSGAPSNQTKWYGTNLTLSSTKPTRTGYSFSKWNTASGGGGTSYASGATYSANASATLYAQWTANTYTVSYNANGGSGAPSNQTKTYGVNLTLSSTIPTRTNYNFLGWGTSASSTTVSYAAGATYSENSAITLYAIWELAYWKPKITNVSVSRCDSSGTSDEYGAYAKVGFSWELCQLLGTNNKATVTIDVYEGDLNISRLTTNYTGKSGTVSKIVSGIDIGNFYTISVTVADAKDGSSSLTINVPSSAFPIDFLAGGKGVNFGGAASEEGFHCDWPAMFSRGLTEVIPVVSNGNCNTLITTGKYYIGANGTNKPGSGLNGWLESKLYSTNYCYQIYTTYTGLVYKRLMNAGTWSSWVSAALDAYPVGAVYISYVSTSPASLFGGTWTAITGRFPYFNAGTATGGSNTHTLTVTQMPSHSHAQYVTANSGGSGLRNDYDADCEGLPYQQGVNTGVTGGGSSHNNMPAYQTLYAWRRTA